MHHVLLDRWSRQTSPLHNRDARAKIFGLLAFLVLLATTPADAAITLGGDTALLISGVLLARLPVAAVLLRAMIVLPLSLTFGAISWAAGDPGRGAALIEKSYLSTVAVILVIGTTPMPALLNALRVLGLPSVLGMVTQSIYRYLFVISEQAQHVRLAAACRGGTGQGRRKLRFRAASGALAVLFARSYYRAEGIHRAMLARGFQGKFFQLKPQRFRTADGVFTFALITLLILLRVPL